MYSNKAPKTYTCLPIQAAKSSANQQLLPAGSCDKVQPSACCGVPGLLRRAVAALTPCVQGLNKPKARRQFFISTLSCEAIEAQRVKEWQAYRNVITRS